MIRYVRALVRGRGLVGAAIVVALTAVGLLGPFLTPFDPTQPSSNFLARPGSTHPLGTDEIGRDLLSRVVHGIRVDLLLALVAVPVGAVIGTTVGLLASSHPAADVVAQRIFDVFFAFPGFFIALAIATALTPGVTAIALTIIVFAIPGFGRMTRNQVLLFRGREYVVASRLVGARPFRLLFKHVLPNAADPLVVQLALLMSFAVFIEGGLSFVGFGVQAPQPSLGGLLQRSLPFLATNLNYALSAIVPITALTVGFNLIGDAMNRALLRT